LAIDIDRDYPVALPAQFQFDSKPLRINANCCIVLAKPNQPNRWDWDEHDRREKHDRRDGLLLYQSGKREFEKIAEVENVPYGLTLLASRARRARVCFVQELGRSARLCIYGLKREQPTAEWEATRAAVIDLGREVSCFTVIDQNHVAVGYHSKLIEIISVERSVATHKKALTAVAFTLCRPTSMRVSSSSHGLFLVVAAEDFLWFELPFSADSPS
jgi:hypothetical protein